MMRAVEFLLSLLGLLVTAPLILLLVLAIRYDSPGPGIFRQKRVGREGKSFVCYKLRTMASGTPDLPTHDASTSYVTSTGKFLRKVKLDELPQLWNVLKGEMSFVGPRPCLESQTELIQERQKRGVLSIRPGITGLAQIQNIDMSNPVRLANVDAEYLQKRSFALDLRILLLTVLGGAGRGDRVGV
jgi:O-antigen biosynthesis protein WbqP